MFFDVKQYGAAGDGQTLDTAAINKAIDAAAKAGGGTVYFPAGTYRSFSIRLQSNVALFLDHGATILAAEPNESQGYDAAEANEWGDKHKYQDFGHSHWHDSLIWGENLDNVSILGPGTDPRQGTAQMGQRSAGRGEQGDCFETLPKRHYSRCDVSDGGAFLHSADRGGQLHDR